MEEVNLRGFDLLSVKGGLEEDLLNSLLPQKKPRIDRHMTSQVGSFKGTTVSLCVNFEEAARSTDFCIPLSIIVEVMKIVLDGRKIEGSRGEGEVHLPRKMWGNRV